MTGFKDWMNSNLIKLYHGGQNWNEKPTIFPSKGKRYEHGNGIYLTTSYNTARKYAKGGKVVLAVYIDSNFKKISDIKIAKTEMLEFLKSNPVRHKKEIIQDIESRYKDIVPLYVLNNLIVNYESGSGNIGLAVNKFIVSHGADLEVVNQHDEDWVVVFNPKIIKKWEKVNPQTVNEFELPLIKSYNNMMTQIQNSTQRDNNV